MIIVDTPSEHYEIEESRVITESPTDLAFQQAIVAMHATDSTFERVILRARQICPTDCIHTFADWEDACIRGLMELHCQVTEEKNDHDRSHGHN